MKASDKRIESQTALWEETFVNHISEEQLEHIKNSQNETVKNKIKLQNRQKIRRDISLETIH